MTDLSPMTATAASPVHETRTETIGALSIRENTGLALASLALCYGAPLPAPMGVRLPGPGLWHGGNGVSAFWMGPDHWMLEGEERGDRDFAGALSRVASDCKVTGATDGWVAFEIVSTDGAAPLLNLVGRLADIDAAAFGPGSAAQKMLDGKTVFVIRRSQTRLAVIGARDDAACLWRLLTATAEGLARVSA